MASQPVRRETRRATAADTEPEERRGWLSYGLAALGISALGLAIAGSVSLTTSAQPLPVKEPASSSAAAQPQTTDAGRRRHQAATAEDGGDQTPSRRAAG